MSHRVDHGVRGDDGGGGDGDGDLDRHDGDGVDGGVGQRVGADDERRRTEEVSGVKKAELKSPYVFELKCLYGCEPQCPCAQQLNGCPGLP